MVKLFFKKKMSNSMVQARHPFQWEDPTLLGALSKTLPKQRLEEDIISNKQMVVTLW